MAPIIPGKFEITSSSGWNSIPVDSSIVFVFLKTSPFADHGIRVNLSGEINSPLADIRATKKWSGTINLRHGSKRTNAYKKILATTSNPPPYINGSYGPSSDAERTVEIKFVYVEQ